MSFKSTTAARSFRLPAITRERVTSVLWALARIWVGWQFLQASFDKIGAAAWTGAHAGAAVRGFLGYAASSQATGGPYPQVLRPYAWLDTHVLLSHAVELSYLVTAGEFLVGVTLMLGLGTRVAALGGAFLNIIYLLSGSAGMNVPMLPIDLSILLVGTSSGLVGLDAVVLPALQKRVVRVRAQWLRGRRQDLAPARGLSTRDAAACCMIVTVTTSTFTGNRATDGEALYHVVPNGQATTATNHHGLRRMVFERSGSWRRTHEDKCSPAQPVSNEHRKGAEYRCPTQRVLSPAQPLACSFGHCCPC